MVALAGAEGERKLGHEQDFKAKHHLAVASSILGDSRMLR